MLRIHHPLDGQGIYTSRHRTELVRQIVTRRYDSLRLNLNERFPGPYDDTVLYQNLCEKLPAQYRTSIRHTIPRDLIFGFASKAQLFKWFSSKSDLREFANSGFVIAKCYGRTIVGSCQAAMLKSDMTKMLAFEINEFI